MLTLFTVLVLSTLAAGIVLVTQTQVWTSYNYRLTAQARYAAEAGIQRTMNWLNNSYAPPTSIAPYTNSTYPVTCATAPCTSGNVVLSAVSGVPSNYPDATQQSAFNSALSSQTVTGVSNATFSTYATLLQMNVVSWLGNTGVAQTWQITSQGSISGVRNATVQVVATYKRTTTPLFNYGIAATGTSCGAISLSGSDRVTAFNSATGASVAGAATVATNGNISLGGSSSIDGTLYDTNTAVGACPDGITGSSSAYGGTSQLSTPLSYPNPAAPSPTPPTTSQTIQAGSCSNIPAGCTQVSGYVVLSPNYQYGNLSIQSGSTVVHLSAGTYNINSLSVGGSATVVLDSYPVIVNIAGAGLTGTTPAVSLSGGTTINAGGIPANFQIVYGGSQPIVLSGGPQCYGVVYAPNSPISMSGTSTWSGAIVAGTFTDNGHPAVNYDVSLANSLQKVGPYVPIGFGWSKF